MLKLRSIFIIFLFSIFFSPSPTLAVEHITGFESHIKINSDRSLTVSEKIRYFTDENKHGIYRYLPNSFAKGNLVRQTPIKILHIVDEGEQPYSYGVTKENNNLVIKIGDPNSTFTGQKSYNITYQVENALETYDDYHELYWDITGEGWTVPILSARSEIRSESANILEVKCFSGAYGSDDGLCNAQNYASSAIFSYDEGINYGDNFTILLKLDKNGQLQSSVGGWFWRENLWLFILPWPVIIMFYLWYKKGRDYAFVSSNLYNLDPSLPTKHIWPWEKTRAPYYYEPFKSLTPGEAGTLYDEKADDRDVVAEIIELARRKFLKIELIKKKGFFGKDDYRFTKLKQTEEGLNEAQKLLMKGIFETGSEKKLSELKGKFYLTNDKVKKELNNALVKKKLYLHSPNNRRVIYFMISLGLIVLAGLSSFPAMEVGIFWPILVLVMEFFINAYLSYHMVQRSALGYGLSLQIKGLQKTINYGKWREEIKEKDLFIEEILPFAVSLGVVGKLARDMKNLNIKPPEYLRQMGITNTAHMMALNGMTNTFAQSISYNPSSSSGSGGSGFGGGSSGGGGGGGGGGSW